MVYVRVDILIVCNLFFYIICSKSYKLYTLLCCDLSKYVVYQDFHLLYILFETIVIPASHQQTVLVSQDFKLIYNRKCHWDSALI